MYLIPEGGDGSPPKREDDTYCSLIIPVSLVDSYKQAYVYEQTYIYEETHI